MNCQKTLIQDVSLATGIPIANLIKTQIGRGSDQATWLQAISSEVRQLINLAAGKFINDWKRKKETQVYLQGISNKTGIAVSFLIKYETGSVSSTTGIPVVDLIRQDKSGNNNRHTWAQTRCNKYRTCSYIYSPSI